MKTILLLVTILCLHNLYAQTSVYIAFSTTESAEPHFVDSFIAGYESTGKMFKGNIKLDSNRSPSAVVNVVMPYCVANGYNLVLVNQGMSGYDFTGSQYYSDSVELVCPAGSNQYRYFSNTDSIGYSVRCGSGYTSNATGYKCEFWDIDPFANAGTINWIMRGDTSYSISSITRITDSTMRISIIGLTDVLAYGFEHGVPIRISGLSGTNISPLPPDSTYYLTSANNNGNGRLFFNFRTTSGTLGSDQTLSAGSFKTGTNDSNVLIKTITGQWATNNGITIYGVSGFSNNPNGAMAVKKEINADGFYTKFEIRHLLGIGKYVAGSGNARFDTESYSSPFIAGKLAAIKDSLKCSWWWARKLLRETATGNGSLWKTKYSSSFSIQPNK